VPKEGGALRALCEDIKKGETDKRKLFETYGDAYVRVYKGIDHAISLIKKPKPYARKERPKNSIWFGNAGAGKSWDIEQTAIDAGLSMFKVPMKQLEKDWYNGYEGEEILWLDEFRGGTMKPQHFLEFLDGLALLPVKNGYAPSQVKYIFMASPHHPINWWPQWYAKEPNNWAQVKRRLDQVLYVCDQVVTKTDLDNTDEYKLHTESVVIKDYQPKFNE